MLPGIRPSPIHTIECCIANSDSDASVWSLSPFTPAEFVKPAASLSFQACSAQRPDVESMNALNGADGPAM